MATSNIQIFKRTGFKYVNDSSATEGSVFWDNPVIASYVSRWINGDNSKIQTKAPGNTTRGDSPLVEAMDVDWRPYKILTGRSSNVDAYTYLATTTDLMLALNKNYIELKDAVSNAQTSANTISYSLSTTGKIVTLSGSNPSSSLTFGGDNWINIAGPANATITGELTFTHGAPNIANNTGTTKGGGTSEIITKITYDSKGHIADVVKGTLTTEKLETDGNGKVVKQVVLDGYKLKVAYTNTITNATNATNATNVDLSLTYDTSTGIKVQAGSGTAGTLKATLAQGSDHNKVKLQLGGSNAGSEVTINDVEHATNADTATNLDAAPVLSAGTNNGNAIKVTVGGQTSDEFLVPYANRVSVHSTVGTNNTYFLLAGKGAGLGGSANATTPSKPTGLGKYAYLYRTDSNSSTYTYIHNLHTNVSVEYNNGIIVTVGDIQSSALPVDLSYTTTGNKGLRLTIGNVEVDTVPFKLATSGSGSSAKIGLRIDGQTAGSDITVPYATSAGSATNANYASSSSASVINALDSATYLVGIELKSASVFDAGSEYTIGLNTHDGRSIFVDESTANLYLNNVRLNIIDTGIISTGSPSGNIVWTTDGGIAEATTKYWKNATGGNASDKNTVLNPDFTSNSAYVQWSRNAVKSVKSEKVDVSSAGNGAYSLLGSSSGTGATAPSLLPWQYAYMYKNASSAYTYIEKLYNNSIYTELVQSRNYIFHPFRTTAEIEDLLKARLATTPKIAYLTFSTPSYGASLPLEPPRHPRSFVTTRYNGSAYISNTGDVHFSDRPIYSYGLISDRACAGSNSSNSFFNANGGLTWIYGESLSYGASDHWIDGTSGHSGQYGLVFRVQKMAPNTDTNRYESTQPLPVRLAYETSGNKGLRLTIGNAAVSCSEVGTVPFKLSYETSGNKGLRLTIGGVEVNTLGVKLVADTTNNKIGLSIGGQTAGDSITVPYATNAGNADTVDGYHIANGTGTNANTIYIVT